MSETAQPKRLYIKTYGCQMNVYDSERMADVLAPLGYAMTDAPEGADLVVLNTCHIREKATEKVYSELGKIREMKEARAASGGAMTVALAGCVAQAEARSLAEQGVREVTLLGQNVNAYSGEGGLAALVRRLAKIPDLDRIRYTTSHPRDMDDALIAAHAEVEALMPYLHLPVQSGSDQVLKAMNRAHTAETYLRLIEKIRASRPDIAISGD